MVPLVAHRLPHHSLSLLLLVTVLAQPSLAGTPFIVSFEQSEGFPAPVFIPNMAPGGIRDPFFNFTGFAGGPDSGYAGHPNGPVPDKPETVTNGGMVANWGVASVHSNPSISTEARQLGTWFVDDGPGGLDLFSGGVRTCLGEPAACDPAPVSGAAMAGFGLGMEGGLNYGYAGHMDLNNGAILSMDSFYYANRGNGPPHLQVEYYGLDESFLGMSSHTTGTVGNPWVGVGPLFEPKFQLITTPAPFAGVPLSKVVFRSLHDPSLNGEPGPGHGTFFLDDILLNPVNNPGDFNNDGELNASDVDWLASAIRASTTNTLFDTNNDNVVDSMDLDHWVNVLKGTEFGDTNLDGIINAEDAIPVFNSFSSNGGWASGNFNLDELIDANDLALFRQNEGFIATSAPAPEPSTMGLLFAMIYELTPHRKPQRNRRQT